MRPTTPHLDFSHQAGPSSPPQTPITPSFPYRQYKTRRNGMFFAESSSATAGIEILRTNGLNPSFFNQTSELSPRSSSPASSIHSSNLSASPPPRSLSSSPGLPASPPPKRRIITTTKANFTVEEFGSSDYEEFDSDVDSIIRPSQYEDAESDRGAAALKSLPLDPKMVYAFNKLCANSDNESEDSDYAAREAYLQHLRSEKRRKRRSSSSFKRTLAQSIGSDTDDEDLMPGGLLDANDAGSSARRLRRKTMGERTSLIFDDPPERIEELEEPESCEEVVEVEDGEEEVLGDGLPYWVQEEEEEEEGTDLDSSASEESNDE